MAVTDLTTVTPNTPNLNPYRHTSPYTGTWWNQFYVSGVPHETMSWMIAQGWRVLGTTLDRSQTPPVTYYTLGREAMQNWVILQSLMNQLTIGYNDANEANSLRYNAATTPLT